MGLWIAVALALAFAFSNGFNDAASAIATLVATRGARPAQAMVVSSLFNMLGALLMGAAVAGTVAGIVAVPSGRAVAAIGAAVLAALTWNLFCWSRGLPASSGHALVGGLVGAGLAGAGRGAVNWGGLRGVRPDGVLGALFALGVSPVLGFLLALALARVDRRLLRRATHAVDGPIRAGQWGMTAALSFSHGANDAQKSMGVVAACLVATGRLDSFSVPLWVKLACGAAFTIGTTMGGWRIVRTVGRRLFHLAPLGALSSQTASSAVILASSLVGAPVSTTQVVASSVVGIGGGRRRWGHVRWSVVRSMAFAWILTLPATAGLAALGYEFWSAVG